MTKNEQWGYRIAATCTILLICIIGYSLVNNEPIKERQQFCVINSNGWDHVYPVNGKNVKIEYEEVE